MLKLDLNPAPRVLRQFAIFAIVGLPLLAGLVLRLLSAWSWSHPAFLLTGALGLAQAVLLSAGQGFLSRWLYVGLTTMALPIGFVVSHVLMAAIYYLLITPIGLVFRCIGRDVMGRKLDPQRSSYWHDRGPQRPPASYFRLY